MIYEQEPPQSTVSYFAECSIKMKKKMLLSHMFVWDGNVQIKIHKNHVSFVLIPCYKSIPCKQLTQMADYQRSSESDSSLSKSKVRVIFLRKLQSLNHRFNFHFVHTFSF